MTQVPTPPGNTDDERDKLIRHAQYLIDRGFVKGVALNTLIEQLKKSKDTPLGTTPSNKKPLDTFGDLEDFM